LSTSTAKHKKRIRSSSDDDLSDDGTRAEGTAAEPTTPASTTDKERPRSDFWDKPESFQPSDILNKQATKGSFSLQTILSTTDDQAQPVETASAFDESTDPIQRGLVDYSVAVSLFEE
jgi:hypothetical protein